MIGKLIGATFGILGALLPLLIGVGASEYWERRLAGQPQWANVHFLLWHWSPPESLAAQRDQARAQLVVAQRNVITITRAITVQNAAVQAQAAAGVKAMAQASIAVQRFRSGAPAVSRRVAIISAPLTGDDVCARVKDADAKFTGTLRGVQ